GLGGDGVHAGARPLALDDPVGGVEQLLAAGLSGHALLLGSGFGGGWLGVDTGLPSVADSDDVTRGKTPVGRTPPRGAAPRAARSRWIRARTSSPYATGCTASPPT